MEFTVINSLYNNRVLSGVIINWRNTVDVVEFLDECEPVAVDVMRKELERMRSYKINVELATEYVIKKGNEEFSADFYFKTKMRLVDHGDELDQVFSDMKENLLMKMTEFHQGASGKALVAVYYLQINICLFDPFNGSSWIDLPAEIKNRQACVNVKNHADKACFFWAITSALFPAKNHVDRLSSYPHYQNKFKVDGIHLPVSFRDIPIFENLNNVSVNVYGLNQDGTLVNGVLYQTRKRRAKHVNLLFLSRGDDDGHFVWIKDLTRLVGPQLSLHQQRKFVCERCLFYCQEVERFNEHAETCNCERNRDQEQILILPKAPNNVLKFRNFSKQLMQPFTIYCDIECILPSISTVEPNPKNSYVMRKQQHVPCALGFALKYFKDDNCRFFQIITGKNCVEEFILKLEEISKLVNEVYDNPVPLRMTPADHEAFRSATHCHICREKFVDNDKDLKVADHCHFTNAESNFRGAGHQSCNLNFFPRKTVSVFWHNGTRYDFKMLIKAISNVNPNIHISVVPLTNENYVSFTIKLNGVNFRFLDSFRFLQASLDSIVKTVEKEKLRCTKMHFGDKFDIMASKGVFPYEYCRSWESLEETKLPPREKFFSSLTDATVSEEEYERALKVWDAMKCDSLQDYMECYLTSDVLLLLDVFENFRNCCMKVDGLDPAWYFTLPGLSFDSMLKMTGAKIELLQDEDKLVFFEKALRGGLSQVSGRYAKANNKYMKDFDANAEETYILYLDINNEYGWALSQQLPTKNFVWDSDPANFDIQSVDTTNHGYFLEVDLKVPDHLHQKFRDLPPAPIHGCPPGSKTMKLLATLEPKKNYVCHIDALRFFVSLGVQVEKIHRVLKFDHSAWMAPYIERNTKLREAATSTFEKNFFKLKNNACYGKTIEQVRKRRDIKLVTKWEGRGGARKLIASSNFKGMQIFSPVLAAIEMRRTKIVYDKPIFVGSTVLELSKLLFYDIFYSKIKPYFGDESLSLLYVDTDSYILKIVEKDPYEFIKKCPELFDTSDYDPNNPYGIKLMNKKKIGLVKDEACGKQIIEYIALCSKMYAFRLEGEEEEETCKAKGIGRSIMRKITVDDYRNCLFAGDEYEPVLKKQCRITSKNLNLFTVEENKKTLSHKDDKRILINNFETIPYGYNGPY